MKQNDDLHDLVEVTLNFCAIEYLFKAFDKHELERGFSRSPLAVHAMAGNILLNLLDEFLEARRQMADLELDPGAMLAVDLVVNYITLGVLEKSKFGGANPLLHSCFDRVPAKKEGFS